MVEVCERNKLARKFRGKAPMYVPAELGPRRKSGALLGFEEDECSLGHQDLDVGNTLAAPDGLNLDLHRTGERGVCDT